MRREEKKGNLDTVRKDKRAAIKHTLVTLSGSPSRKQVRITTDTDNTQSEIIKTHIACIFK